MIELVFPNQVLRCPGLGPNVLCPSGLCVPIIGLSGLGPEQLDVDILQQLSFRLVHPGLPYFSSIRASLCSVFASFPLFVSK